MANIIEKIPELIKATESGSLKWVYMNDAPCLTAFYNNEYFILCKAENDDNIPIISLNYIDKNEMLIGNFKKWKQTESEYDKLESLYKFAEEKRVPITC